MGFIELMNVRIEKKKCLGNVTPADYLHGVCHIHKAVEWQLMESMDLEIEYTAIIITHEQIHALIGRILRNQKYKDSLLHKGDVCSFLGF